MAGLQSRGTLCQAGPFSSRSSPRLPGPSTPSPVAGEGWDGGEKHGLGTPLVFTPTLAFPRLRGREKTDRRGSRKLNDPDQQWQGVLDEAARAQRWLSWKLAGLLLVSTLIVNAGGALWWGAQQTED